MLKKPAPFNAMAAEDRVIEQIAKRSHMSVAEIRKLVDAEDSETSEQLEDGMRIEKLSNRFPNVKVCPTCGSTR